MPRVFNQLLPKELLEVDVVESAADCSNCSMATGSTAVYRPDLKCCTFHPYFPNYSIGEALLDPKAQAVVATGMKHNSWLLPIGWVPSPKYQVEFEFMNSTEFGQREDLLCPFYNRLQGGCVGWRLRPSACVSFYCKSSYGEAGKEFWAAVKGLLHQIEMAFAQEVMLQQGFSWSEVELNLEWVKISRADMIEPLDELGSLIDELDRELWAHYQIKDQTKDQAKKLSFYENSKLLVDKHGKDWFKERPHWHEQASELAQMARDMVTG